MNTSKTIICIRCPLGCSLTITKLNQPGTDEFIITGNKCLRGKKYAAEEMTAPKRTITSTVKISGSAHPVIPIKTSKPIPKEKIFTIMQILAKFSAVAPVYIGNVMIHNIADTEVDIIATKTIL